MKRATIDNNDIVVVGNYFAINGVIYNSLGVGFHGQETNAWLSEAFSKNCEENWGQLRDSDDEIVRLLALRNLEGVEDMLDDKSNAVCREALFTYQHTAPVSDYESGKVARITNRINSRVNG